MEEMLQSLRLGFILRDVFIYSSLILLGVLTLLLVLRTGSYFIPKKKTFFEREYIEVGTNFPKNKKDNRNLFIRKVRQH